MRGRVWDQFGVVAIGAAWSCKVGSLLFNCVVRLLVTDPAHDVGVHRTLSRPDHVQHLRVPVVAADAEHTAGRKDASEPERLRAEHLPLLHLIKPGRVKAERCVVGRQCYEVSVVFESRLSLLCVHC